MLFVLLFFPFSGHFLASFVLVVSTTEREIRQVVGSIAQFPSHRSVHVPQQLSGLQPGEADGSQIDRRPTHQYHFLPNEGNAQIKTKS